MTETGKLKVFFVTGEKCAIKLLYPGLKILVTNRLLCYSKEDILIIIMDVITVV